MTYPIFDKIPNLKTLMNRIISVTHRLALKLDSENSDEYMTYMNNGFWHDYVHWEIANAIVRLQEDECYENLPVFNATMVSHVITILLSLKRPMESSAVSFADSPKMLSELLLHYLDVGRYQHESITDRVYYDRPLFREDAEEGRWKLVRNIIDVLAVMLAVYLEPDDAMIQFNYLVSGISNKTGNVNAKLDDCLNAMQHRDLDKLAWEYKRLNTN